MLDIGWTELFVVAVILIVVVGPKDLPPMLRAFGKMTSRLRKTAGEFRHQFDEALRESELDDVRKTISDVRSLNPANAMRDAVNPLRKMGEEIKADLKKAATPDSAKSSAAVDEKKSTPMPEMSSPLPPIDTGMFKDAAPATLPDPIPGKADVPPDTKAKKTASSPKSAKTTKAASKPASADKVASSSAKAKPAAPARKTAVKSAPAAKGVDAKPSSAAVAKKPAKKPAAPKTAASEQKVAAKPAASTRKPASRAKKDSA